MATFTELLPAQISSKHNGIRWTPGKQAGTGLLTIHTARVSVNYLVVEFGTTWDGRAFHLAKCDEGSDKTSGSYEVFCGRNPREYTCSCAGFAYGSGKKCKHLLAVDALLENEALWGRPADQVNPDQDTSSTECPY